MLHASRRHQRKETDKWAFTVLVWAVTERFLEERAFNMRPHTRRERLLLAGLNGGASSQTATAQTLVCSADRLYSSNFTTTAPDREFSAVDFT